MAGHVPCAAVSGNRRRLRTTAPIAAVVLLCAGLITLLPGPSAVQAAPATSRFVAVAPVRLADTRAATCTCAELDPSTVRVQVAGRDGVPASAVAAALTVTATNTGATGYMTAWPSGSARQETSTLNWAARQTRANGTVVPLGQGGAIDVYVDGGLARADVIVDVTGVFVASDATSAGTGSGHFQSVASSRLLDTRNGAPMSAGSTRRVPLPAGVPADATAVAINVTATGSHSSGYLTAYAADTGQPPTSTVNTDGPDQTRAATAIVPVTAAGIDLYSSATTHALVDVSGWFTGASAGPSATGLFVPVAPTRMFDTRHAAAPLLAGTPLRMYGDTPAAASALSGIMPTASALVFNATSADAQVAGFLTAYPADTTQPGTSTLNWSAGDNVANLTISPSSTNGVAFAGSAPTQLIVDLTGYFTGQPVVVTAPAPPPTGGAAQEPAVAAIVSAGVPQHVMAQLSNVELGFLPYGDVEANPTCFGTVGLTTTQFTSTSDSPTWKISFQRISLAQGLATACPTSIGPASAAAHEVGHILIMRWVYESQAVAEQGQRDAQVDALQPGGEECLAESVAMALFAMKGIGPYSSGYGGTFRSCATAPATQAIAQQVIAASLD